MTFYNIRNFDRFIEVVNSCEGAVDAVSPEGKHYDLKTYAGQFAEMANLVAGGRIRRMEVEAAAEEDAARLVSYGSRGRRGQTCQLYDGRLKPYIRKKQRSCGMEFPHGRFLSAYFSKS